MPSQIGQPRWQQNSNPDGVDPAGEDGTRDFTIHIAGSAECYNCAEPFPIAEAICPNCNLKNFRLPFDEFFGQLEAMRIMDARFGGLVLGRDGIDDDIPMYQFVEGAIFTVVGVMKGGEYIMSRRAGIAHRAELAQINGEKGDTPPMRLPATPITTINVNLLPLHAAIWIEPGMYIVNRYATAKHLERLEHLNASSFEDGFYAQSRLSGV